MTKILIVEDSPTQAEKLRLILEAYEYGTESATDVPTARALLSETKFDLVISDIIMPGETGYDLCRHIKADPAHKDTPVILLSTLGDPMDIISGLECGADNFVTKPYEPEQIAQRIETVLESRKVRAESKLRIGVEVIFLDRTFTVTSDKEQILDLLMSTFEDIVRTNRGLQQSKTELAAAKAQIETYAQSLERRVEERTAELSEQKRLLDDAQAIAHIGSWRWALDSEIFEWSDEMYRICGVERETFDPRLRSVFSIIHPDDREAAEDLFDKELPGGASINCETRVVLRGGETRQCRWQGWRKHDAGAELLVGFCQDITDTKAVEKQLRQAQKMEAVGQLTGGIAHDFNNLLTVVVGNLDALCGRADLTGDSRQRVEMALAASLRGADLIRQLLAFSRKQQLKLQPCDVNEIVEHATALLGRTLRGNIEIRRHLGDGLRPVHTDPAQIESAIANLAINARDAMPEGGTITIETANKVLDEIYASHEAEVTAGEYTMIAITDTGSGMAPDVLARVFEPFYTTKEVGKGSGLGLSMVYGFVKQCGGHIKIYSEQGRGTTVRLYLPRAAQAAQALVATGKSDAEMPRGSETILIVEDDAMVRELAVRQLCDLGYTVLEAETGARALDVLRSGRPIDLLFTDVVMPGGMSGIDLAKKIADERPGLKVLFTSGFAEASLQNGSDPENLSPVLSKPYRYNELARMIRSVLRG